VSARRDSLWLRLYPRAWRARYGKELEDLVVETSGGGRPAWRVRRDLVRTGAGERLRSWGLAGDGVPPETQAKAGALLVLCAWSLFVVAGAAVQRFSEHWQDFTPLSGRALPTGAFQTLVVAALVGSGLVLVGGACVLPRLLGFLRGGGWGAIRRPVIRAVLTGLLATGATVGLALWAHRLDASQRNGHDLPYGLAFVVAGLFVAACLAAWTAALVTTARRIELSVAASLTMLAMTIATATWWAALASRAPGALHEQPIGADVSPLVIQLMVAMVLMVVATGLAVIGASRALRALPLVAAE
jgi:hypothetical protein